MIGYPNKKAVKTDKVPNNANKGMGFEKMIDQANEYYNKCNIAYVNKRPTPIKIIETENKYNIKKASFLCPSTLDYVGVFQGHYLDFDAKETSSKKAFPLSNVAKHQFIAIDNVIRNKGIAFVLIHFKAYEETYLYDGNLLLEAKTKNQAAISYEEIVTKGIKILPSYHVFVDYIKAVSKFYFAK